MTPFRTVLAMAAIVLVTACAIGQAPSNAVDEGAVKDKMADARPGMPDLSEAAAKLGISVESLKEAMSKAGGPPPDMKKVAAELGISVEDLKAALPSRGQSN